VHRQIVDWLRVEAIKEWVQRGLGAIVLREFMTVPERIPA